MGLATKLFLSISFAFPIIALSPVQILGQSSPRWSGTLFHTRDGKVLTAEDFASAVADDDVVFLGEEHDNDAGHAWQLSIIRALHRQGVRLAISMEMFERDVQGVLDDYLAGRMSEEEFLAKSRQWPNYRQHYRPIIEFARRQRIRVIAANVPRPLASQTARGQSIDGEPEAWRPRWTTAPSDRYWDKFAEVMQGHGGAESGDAVRKMYAAQCLKDDAMAESIADFMDTNRHGRVLVVHLCGKFHSDFGLGTADRLVQRQRLARIVIVTMESASSSDDFVPASRRDRAHYVLVVPPNRPQPAKRD
ncbi:MAG TPA: ChaN family lipoprotein [Pirellulaceae bacterium]|nr:ChaN family lipoprotein [Pirellulaceae bacterium]